MRYQYLLFLSILFACSTPERSRSTVADHQKKWVLTGFEKVDSLNPVLQPSAELQFECPVRRQTVGWAERNVLNPAAVVKDGKVHLFFRAQDASGTSRVGMAVSEDGLHFRYHPAPVFFPERDKWKDLEWDERKTSGKTWFDGVEDPRIVERPDGGYLMTYTAYDGKTARLCLATSKNLLEWKKHGPVLRDKKYENYWSKSGAIVSRREGSRTVAAKINGKYWMYFGDTDLFMATSDDLLSWEPLENPENQQLIRVLHPRPGYFDSRLVEPGPYALMTDDGILLVYNGSNAAEWNDPSLPKFTYAAGQALFDPRRPYRLIDRTEGWFIHPDKPYERTGEVNEVCFVEGLVYFKGKWILYYGTADSRIAVAVRK